VTDGPRLTAETQVRDGIAVVVLAGEVDLSTAEAFRTALAGPPGAREVVADLRGITFMDSSGVLAIDGARRQAAAAGRGLRFRPGFGESVRLVLSLTGLLEALPMTEENAEAGP